MAQTPVGELVFEGTCPDCGRREVTLPPPLPEVGDDFDWLAREYDRIRLFMMEELAARFPERRRWTPGELEVVIVEALAALLDQLSDMADRVAAEGTLETARRPESVRRLLQMIGYNAVQVAAAAGEIQANPETQETEATLELEKLWRGNPFLMDAARDAGPRAIHTQHRMVTLDDYARRMEDHPLIQRADARHLWTGSWNTIRVTIIAWDDGALDQPQAAVTDDLKAQVDRFHEDRELDPPDWAVVPTLRTILRPYVNAYRMAGQEVVLDDAIAVPVTLTFSIRIAPNFFRSEVLRAVGEVLGTGEGGFFKPGRLAFGEDLHTSDFIEVLMALEGVDQVCINRFKKLGGQFPDQSATGRIVLDDLEVAVCENNPSNPARGYYRVILHGGQRG